MEVVADNVYPQVLHTKYIIAHFHLGVALIVFVHRVIQIMPVDKGSIAGMLKLISQQFFKINI